MKIPPTRRILPAGVAGVAGVAGTAVMTAPVCAAVCPKGIGNCTYPGRCMLFTDADGDRLCDFNLTDATTAPETAASATDGSSVAGTSIDTASPVSVDPGLAGGADILSVSPMVLWAVLFVAVNVILLGAIYSGRTGFSRDLNAGTVALSSLFSLGISGIAVFLLTGDVSLGSTGAVVYMLAGTLLAAYVWCRGMMTKKTALLVLAMTTVFGFVFVAPMMPVYFYGLVAALGDISVIAPGIAAIIILILLTLGTGRTFCAHICPVGTIQELASRLPGKKILVQNRIVPQAVRVVVFAAACIGIAYSVNIMAYTGVESFFSLALTAGFLVFAVVLAVSVVVYRPLCRFLCPFGAVFSVCTAVGKTCIARTDACIECRKCEKICPTGEAGPTERKPECYLCGRCIDACPAEGALAFTDPLSRDLKK